FSKLGRKEIQKMQTDMAEIVEQILDEVKHSTPHKAVINVNNLPTAFADKSLLYQVWMNLISNAIKYSEKKETPIIEIGATDLENEIVYHVKDNGAGFN